MRPSFVHAPVNSLFEDPLVYVNFIYEKRAILFDLGEFQGLTNRQINRVTHVFVSHLHIDHFIGFDRFLRIRLSTEEPFTVVGPPGITEAIEGHLRGYTWNLIEEYPCRFFVIETDGQWAKLSSFSARDSFKRINHSEWQLKEGRVVEEGSFWVRTIMVDHGIPCLVYRLQEQCHVNILKDKLEERGFEVGPWLGRLKEMVRQGRIDEWIDTPHTKVKVMDLMDVVKITEGQSLCYI
ncbi:MAG: ribonuclease Z, partial [Nitrospirae bacterium]